MGIMGSLPGNSNVVQGGRYTWNAQDLSKRLADAHLGHGHASETAQ